MNAGTARYSEGMGSWPWPARRRVQPAERWLHPLPTLRPDPPRVRKPTSPAQRWQARARQSARRHARLDRGDQLRLDLDDVAGSAAGGRPGREAL